MRIIQVPPSGHQRPCAQQQADIFSLQGCLFPTPGPAGHDPALLQREPDGQRTLAAERERRKMATGSADSRCQTIAATAPFSPRKPGNKACQNGAKATNATCIHWGFLQSVPFTRVRRTHGRRAKMLNLAHRYLRDHPLRVRCTQRSAPGPHQDGAALSPFARSMS